MFNSDMLRPEFLNKLDEENTIQLTLTEREVTIVALTVPLIFMLFGSEGDPLKMMETEMMFTLIHDLIPSIASTDQIKALFLKLDPTVLGLVDPDTDLRSILPPIQ